jgi:spermidine/putrescine transport system ATP-binding protein
MSDRIAVMSKGNILQIGTPTEIYEHPVDRFVADFIGESNFIAAAVAERGTRLRLPAGSVVDHKIDAAKIVGEAVTLAVRPERIELVVDGPDALIPGKVENIVYFGTDTTFHVTLDDKSIITVRQQNRQGSRQRFAVGDRVGLKIPSDAMQVLKD